MAEIVNLNKARKLRNRIRKRQLADENVVKFGRTKALKKHEKNQAAKASRDLDGKKREE